MPIKSTNQKPDKIKKLKPVTKTIPIVFTGVSNEIEYDVDSCKNIMKSLQEAGCFEKISININIARSRVISEDAKGLMAFARLQSYNPETGDIEALFIGKNVERSALADTDAYVIVPRVRVGYNSTEVTTILGFEFVPAMEA